MNRLVIVGSSGAGKSRLAVALGRRLGLPVIHADREFWQPGWTDPVNEDYRARIERLTASDGWIFDGTPGRVADIVLPRAEAVLWLEQPVILCLLRAYGRMFRHLGRTRPDMAEGCPEKLNLNLWRYATGFDEGLRPRIEGWLQTYAPGAPVIRLRGDHGVAAFLREPI
jgi:adenylate kinase family enzyme